MRARKGASIGWLAAVGLFAAAVHGQSPPLDAKLLGFELEPVNGFPGGWIGMPPGTVARES